MRTKTKPCVEVWQTSNLRWLRIREEKKTEEETTEQKYNGPPLLYRASIKISSSQDFRRRGRPRGIFFGFYKTRHILLSDSANCTVLLAVILTQYRRVTDGQTEGIAVASTALAMGALWRIVIKLKCGPVPNVMAALSNIGGALCSTPQSLTDTNY